MAWGGSKVWAALKVMNKIEKDADPATADLKALPKVPATRWNANHTTLAAVLAAKDYLSRCGSAICSATQKMERVQVHIG